MLTKSKYMSGLQCQRLLWFDYKKLLPEITLSDQHKFNQGHEFEKYVKHLFDEFVDLTGLEFKENIEKTSEGVKKKLTIFEAGFKFEELFVRSDIIKPNKNCWDLYEIKSTTEVKPEHIEDLAFQKYVLEKNGLKIKKCFVIHLNKEYIKNGDIDPEKLCLKEDVTEQVELIENIEKNIKICLETLSKKEAPEMNISMNCNKPRDCPLKKECWGTLPEYNVTQLTDWRTYWKLMADGIQDIKDIPKGTSLKPKDEIIVESLKKSPYISKEHIKHFLKSLHYPLYHFDFETFDTAVPIFDKTRPYQKLPFQYSLHIEQENGKTKHTMFLSECGDPRPEILKQMKKDLEGTGDIIVYNKSFEIMVMKSLMEDFPEHSKWLQNAIDRIVDLALPFQNYYYYDKAQKGKYSIKKVLPVMTGKSYSDLEINNGGDASMLYFYSHIVFKLDNRDEIRKNLITYCGLDTEGMVWILNKLKKFN